MPTPVKTNAELDRAIQELKALSRENHAPIWRAVDSTGCRGANSNTPRPCLPAFAALVSVAAASQQGGWGSW